MHFKIFCFLGLVFNQLGHVTYLHNLGFRKVIVDYWKASVRRSSFLEHISNVIWETLSRAKHVDEKLAWEGEVGSEYEVFFTPLETSNVVQLWNLWKLPLKVTTQMLLHYALCPLLQSSLLKIRLIEGLVASQLHRLPNLYIIFRLHDALPTPRRTQMWVQVKDSRRESSWGTFPNSQHFEG
jgi:hypothetical protein